MNARRVCIVCLSAFASSCSFQLGSTEERQQHNVIVTVWVFDELLDKNEGDRENGEKQEKKRPFNESEKESLPEKDREVATKVTVCTWALSELLVEKERVRGCRQGER